MIQDGLTVGIGLTAAAMMRNGFGDHRRGVAVPRLFGRAQRWICAINCGKRIADQRGSEGRAGGAPLKDFDDRHFVTADIYWRLLVLYFNARNPIPPVVCVRWAKILFGAENPKYGFGLP